MTVSVMNCRSPQFDPIFGFTRFNVGAFGTTDSPVSVPTEGDDRVDLPLARSIDARRRLRLSLASDRQSDQLEPSNLGLPITII